MSLQLASLVGGSSLYFLKTVGKLSISPSEIGGESGGVKVAVAAAAVSGAYIGWTWIESFLWTKGDGPLARTSEFFASLAGQEGRRKITVGNWIDEYNRLHQSDDPTVRNSAYSRLVNHYYEVSTLFYEVGWGSSFHFAFRRANESFWESIRRHEYYLAGWLGLSPGAKVLDVGCGIGGPYRNIARFTGWDITGVTINEYQVLRGNQLCKQQGLENQCRSIQADFMKLPFADNSFDGVYAIEATCHAPDRSVVYGEIMRVLKPGGTFACYEWCLTDKYDKNNEKHRIIKKQIEEGDGLPDMCHTSECDKALKICGFEVVHSRDKAVDDQQAKPWYLPLTPSWNPFTQRFQFNIFGLFLTTWGLKLLEFLWIAPTGTSKIQTMLQKGGMGCAQGGITGTFTPMYLMVARKPKK